jgi:hypothetical protein
MKRSEMEHNIKEWLLTSGGTQAVDIPGLLDFLESKGMLPPAYESYEKIPASFMFDDVYRKIYVNEWEPEDKA